MDTHWPFTGFRWTLKLGDSSLERARDTQRYAGMLIRLLASSSLLVQLEKVHEVWDLEKTGILPGPSLNDTRVHGHRLGGEIRPPLVRLSNEEDVVELQAIVSSS